MHANNNLKKTKGKITEDPAIALPVGTTLNFLPIAVNHNFKEQAVWLQDWESFEGALLSLHFANESSYSIDGSGVLVAPGIALCAKHVIEPYIDDLLQSECGTICIGIASHGLQIWRINKVTLIPNSDLTILGLVYASDLPPNSIFYQTRITTRLPKIGEKLMIAGFKASKNGFERIDNNFMPISGDVLACTGEVTERYPQGRDKSLLPYPTLEVNCPSWGGMSGGPVFDNNGLLVGLLSTSFSSDDNQGPSYVSLLWPALHVQFEGGWPASYIPAKATLLEMTPDLCAIDKPSSILDRSDYVEYEIWE